MKKLLALAVLVPTGMMAVNAKKQEPTTMTEKTSKTVIKGDTVKVHYTGTLADGTKFDSSKDRGEPLAFQAGMGQMIPGFDAAVMGMKVGEKKTVKIAAKDAYGEHNPALVLNTKRSQFPGGVVPNVGDRFQAVEPGTNIAHIAKVTKVTGDEITLDANHELAGKELTFAIELVEVS